MWFWHFDSFSKYKKESFKALTINFYNENELVQL